MRLTAAQIASQFSVEQIDATIVAAEMAERTATTEDEKAECRAAVSILLDAARIAESRR